MYMHVYACICMYMYTGICTYTRLYVYILKRELKECAEEGDIDMHTCIHICMYV